MHELEETIIQMAKTYREPRMFVDAVDRQFSITQDRKGEFYR